MLERRIYGPEPISPVISYENNGQQGTLIHFGSSKAFLSKPIRLTFEVVDDSAIVVKNELAAMWGNGPTIEEALKNYCEGLIDRFKWLEENKNNKPEENKQLLTREDHIELEELTKYITPRTPATNNFSPNPVPHSYGSALPSLI